MQKGGVLFELLLIVAIIPCAVYCQGLAAAEADAVVSYPQLIIVSLQAVT